MLRVNTLTGFGRRNAGGGATDADATAFLIASGNDGDATISAATHALVIALKGAGVWSKFDAIYPFVGGSSTTHAVNLKNPGTHDMTWGGTVTHDSNGITGNGSTGYGDTGWNQATHGAADDEHVSIYSRTNSDSFMIDCGVTSSNNGTWLCLRSSNEFQTRSQSDIQYGHTVANSLGYFSVNRLSSSTYKTRQNATVETETQDSVTDPVSVTLRICCRNNGGTNSFYSDRNFAWLAVGGGLTESEDGDVRTAVEAFQDALSRGVV